MWPIGHEVYEFYFVPQVLISNHKIEFYQFPTCTIKRIPKPPVDHSNETYTERIPGMVHQSNTFTKSFSSTCFKLSISNPVFGLNVCW